MLQDINASGDIWLNSGDAITQTGGAITGNGLRFDAAGPVTLIQPGNDVVVIAGQTTTGDIQYTDANDLTVDTVASWPSLTGITATSGDITIKTGGLLTLKQNLSAPTVGGIVWLVSGGNILQPSGAITSDELVIDAAGFATLASPANDVNLISRLSSRIGHSIL